MRNKNIDILKGLAIVFVFLGHQNMTSMPLKIYIFSFHMPLFFFVSGVLFSEKALTQPSLIFIKNKLLKRLVPYLFFGVISYPLWLLKHTLNLGSKLNWQTPYYKPLLGLFYGSTGNGYLLHNLPLWFLSCLMTTEIIFYFISRRYRSKTHIFTAISILFFLGYFNSVYNQLRFPFGLDVSLVAIFFFGLGFLFKDEIVEFKFNFTQLVMIGLAHVLFSFLSNEVVLMHTNHYNNMLLFVLSSLCGTAFYFDLAKRMPSMKWLEYIGANSLIFFASEIIFRSPIYFLFQLAEIPVYEENLLLSVISVILSLVLTFPFAYLTKKYARIFVGA